MPDARHRVLRVRVYRLADTRKTGGAKFAELPVRSGELVSVRPILRHSSN